MLVGLSNAELRDEGSSSDLGGANSRWHRPQLWASLLCVAIYSAAVAVIWPVVELATDDDFAYAKIALAFERTGHLIFNGWETTMVGWQVVWGALFIRLFGYSYLTLRFSIIVLGALLTLLLHRVLLRAGVTGAAAVLGTLTVVLSPLFLPMATSYMTDVPALLCIVVCIYGCQRALRARSDRTALLWLCGSAALNVVDGTVRQIAWLGALVIVPSGFWLLRGRRGFKTAAAVTWLLTVSAVSLLMLWFLHQPYTLPEHIIRGGMDFFVLKRLLRLSVYGPLEVLCFSLPVLIAWIFELRALSRRRKLQILALCAAITPLLFLAAHYNKLQGRLPPWSANVVTRYGILWSIPLLGDRPQILTMSILSLLVIVLMASLAGFLIWLKKSAGTDWFRRHVHERPATREELSFYETCVLVVPFSLSYFSLLLPRAAFPSTFSDVFDRYYLPLVLTAVILLLRLLKERQQEISVTCYATLLAFSFFSIMGTHDLFCAYRATAAARAELEASGVAPPAISGPWQEDGANQINARGYINDDRLANPPGAYQLALHPPLDACHYWFGPLVPALHFKYVLTVQKLDCLVPSRFPDLTYTTWLPPFRRTLYIERNPAPY
jgi:hypothetical protein